MSGACDVKGLKQAVKIVDRPQNSPQGEVTRFAEKGRTAGHLWAQARCSVIEITPKNAQSKYLVSNCFRGVPAHM
jgi:hypothetical protein